MLISAHLLQQHLLLNFSGKNWAKPRTVEIELGRAGIRLPREEAALLSQLARLAYGVQRRGQGNSRLLAAAPQGAGFLRPLHALNV